MSNRKREKWEEELEEELIFSLAALCKTSWRWLILKIYNGKWQNQISMKLLGL